MRRFLFFHLLLLGMLVNLQAQSDTLTISGTVNFGSIGTPLPTYPIDYVITTATLTNVGQVVSDVNGNYQIDVIVPVDSTPTVVLTYTDCFMNPLPVQVTFPFLAADTTYDIIFCQNLGCSAAFGYDSLQAGPLSIDFTAFHPGQATYDWSFGDGSTGTGETVTHTYASSGIYGACLFVSDGTGCVDTSCIDVYVGTPIPLTCDASFTLFFGGGPLPCFIPTFVDSSLNYVWDFGDGTTSTDIVACHGFPSNGVFQTCLTVSDPSGTCSDTFCVDVTINGGTCTAGFTYSVPNGTTVDFVSNSYGGGQLTYDWDFGDGTIGTTANPTHQYSADSTYDVCLTITDTSGCSDTYCEQIFVGCLAAFISIPDPADSLTVTYIAIPPNASNYSWFFGDGNSAIGPVVTHTYAASNTYTVCLAVDNGGTCADTSCLPVYVGNNVPTICDATFSPLYTPGSTICFSPLQNGANWNYQWDLGDGTTSTDPFPCHQYSAAFDSATVCLVVTDLTTGCVDSSCMVVYTPTGGCSAQFNATIGATPSDWSFSAIDTTYALYDWDFDGGTLVSSPTPWTPVVQYSSPGIKNVCLMIEDGAGCVDFVCQTIFVLGSNSPCDASFTFSPVGNNAVAFSPHFVTPGANYFWDFGDGNSDTSVSAVHTYASAGAYQVCLFVNLPGGCVDTSCVTISTFPNNPPNNLPILGQVLVGSNPADSFFVYLIEYDSIAGTLTAIDTFSSNVNPTGIPGFFIFDVQPGSYLIKAALDTSSQFYSNYLPTYFEDELFWYNASYIDPVSFPFAVIELVSGANPGGPGFVGGLVSSGANKTGDPMGGMTVIITHMDDSPLTYATTHEDGTFEIGDLPYGTYKVWVEMWGRELNYHVITISPQQPIIDDLDFEISDTQVIAGTSTSLSEFLGNEANWTLFPNPASDQVQLVLDMKQTSEITLIMNNVMGQEVLRNRYETGLGENRIKISLPDLTNGIYLLQLEIEGSRVPLSKLMIQK